MTVRMVATVKRYIGISTDVKPIDNIVGERVWDGSSFFEEDTGKFFFYDQENGWRDRDPNMVTRGGELVSIIHDPGTQEKLCDVLTELKITNLHLSSMSDETFTAGDVL